MEKPRCVICGQVMGVYEWDDKVYIQCWFCGEMNRKVEMNLTIDVKSDVKV